MLNIGGGELLIILLVALVFLGPTRLPEVARQVGQSVASLRSLAKGFQEELEAAAKPDALKPKSTAVAKPDALKPKSTAVVNQIAQANAATATDPQQIQDEARKISAQFRNGPADPTELSDDAGQAGSNADTVSPGGPTDLGADEEE